MRWNVCAFRIADKKDVTVLGCEFIGKLKGLLNLGVVRIVEGNEMQG